MNQELYQHFLEPDSEYSPMPFWFWNDLLSKGEIKSQIHDFYQKGVEGFVLHPRIGIPEDIEYLSDTFMEYIRFAVAEADKLSMHVILYDEAMYPSGAANGKVVEKYPEYASKGLKSIEKEVVRGNQNITLGVTDRLVALYLAPTVKDEIAVESVTTLYPLNIGIIQHKINERDVTITVEEAIIEDFFQRGNRARDNWSIIALIETETMGTIRGIHSKQDDGEINAPRSADLLNPEAVQLFINITHNRYKEVVGNYFGNTIFAMFTDEPDMLGRNAKADLLPWTKGFENDFLAEGFHIEDLLALFYDVGPSTIDIRKGYQKAIHKRLLESYYNPISEWCEQNNLSLTGHPAGSDDIGLLRPFHIPGQDVVWRWVAPEDNKGIEGVHSTAGKCGADAARHYQRRRNINEFLGVCGIDNNWNLSAGDMKWYIDWLAVRGVNLFCPHAFYYSINGKERSHERPPDVGPNNTWWPYYRYFSTYMKRLSWLMTDSVNQAKVAIITKDDQLPWHVAKELFQHQIEFNYLHEKTFVDDLVSVDQYLSIAENQYQIAILDQLSVDELHPIVRQKLDAWVNQGGQLFIVGQNMDSFPGAVHISTSDKIVEQVKIHHPIRLATPNKDIRASLVKKGNYFFFLLVNEGESSFHDSVQLAINGRVELWDPWSGRNQAPAFLDKNNSEFLLLLERRSSVIIAVDPIKSTTSLFDESSMISKSIPLKWEPGVAVNGEHKELKWSDNQLRNWVELASFKDFSGTVIYPFEFDFDSENVSKVQLDLGEVYEIAEVWLNDQLIDVIFWAPYQLLIPLAYLKNGLNSLVVKVTNNSANRMDQLKLPSGLIGPLVLKIT
ncbi:glycosylhydrolase-like jelly roll fold domain-containing protein [Gracilibacillus kekensis]|uniref:Alpha-L-rhamnosidase n=1 Tax=Gracilibacillus kekensis TaxID=1027249 RepID=A0A1M7QWZ8_9BACI|nr:glycosylhydrolase-like jelly roll fold domain-containing protein [Gracilibacillus kekensis]SHN36163.1 alpha-L-rhamnosidase [Gracilibacillus kekensis]